MPIFNFDFTRSVARIDMAAERSGIFTPNLTSLELNDQALPRFNRIAQRFAPEQPAYTLDQIAGAARRVLRAASRGEESAFIKVRMRRAEEMRAAYNDKSWALAPALAANVQALLDYLDNPPTVIEDSVPVVGLLDDAILIDLAMDKMRLEIDDYAEFCRFRNAESARMAIGGQVFDIDRTRWEVERAEELKLEQQLRRARGSRYAVSAAGAGGFRVR